jgi:exopolyphosphatase / guanosine-5'-triphosphate,3'-diphosphate pyrophosphatase
VGGKDRSRQEPGVPLRAAGIDVGSNAMRLVVAELRPPGAWTVLAARRVAVRLGASVFAPGGGALADDVMDHALDALHSFRLRMTELEVTAYRAAATSAVREASNGAAFRERVLAETGLVLETITAAEEARLVWLAVASRMDVADRRWLLVDLGGGSVEVAAAEGERIAASESYAMGTVRLLNALDADALPPEQFRRVAREHIEAVTARLGVDASAASGIIATGGNAEELARLASAHVDARGVARLALRDLRGIIDDLARLSPEQRIERFGFRPDRADVVLPAALVYERVADAAAADTLIVPHVGLREGLLIDAAGTAASAAGDLEAAAVRLGRRYHFEEPHARHVTRLALALFDQLAAEHGMDGEQRRILLAASLLHDIGHVVANRGHHRHSWYLVSHARLPTLSKKDVAMVALVARYHRRAEPSLKHEPYAKLSPRRREQVDRLAGLLRIADALDRGHRQGVRDVSVAAADGVLRLVATVHGDTAAEERAVARKARLLERVMGKRVQARFETATPAGGST